MRMSYCVKKIEAYYAESYKTNVTCIFVCNLRLFVLSVLTRNSIKTILFGQGRLTFLEPNKRLERFAVHWLRSFSVIFSCDHRYRIIYQRDYRCEFITMYLRYAILLSVATLILDE